MKYNVNNYFKKYIMYLSDKMSANIQEKDILTYLRALSNCDLIRESINNDSQNEISFQLAKPDCSFIQHTFIDLTDNSLNCETNLNEAYFRIKLVNDKLYYSIYFASDNEEEKLNGIYFYEVDENGNKVCKFYDNNVIIELSYSRFKDKNFVNADDLILQIHGFEPDYEERHDYNGVSKFDTARAFNDLILTMDYEKTIAFISSLNKKTKYEYILELGKNI